MVSLSIERLAEEIYLVRLHEEGGVFGDPYVGVCTVHFIDGKAYVKGFVNTTGDFTRSNIEELKKSLGVGKLYFERRSNFNKLRSL